MTKRSGIFADFSFQALTAGFLSAFVGFAGSFAIVVQGLTAAGASPAEAASGLMALSISMGLCGIFLSLKSRLPISVAWSTPGAALLATSLATAIWTRRALAPAESTRPAAFSAGTARIGGAA